MTPKVGVARVTCPTFEAMGQIPVFHRTYLLLFRIHVLPVIGAVENYVEGDAE